METLPRADAQPCRYLIQLVRLPGVAPGHSPWRGDILLLNHSRENKGPGASLHSRPGHFLEPVSKIAVARVAEVLAMRQGARMENIPRGSSTDEQRRRIAKGMQPFGLYRFGRLALLLLGHRALAAMLPRRAAPVGQSDTARITAIFETGSIMNKHLLVIYSIPTRGFTAAVSVFEGTPPTKPLNCKSVSNRSGQRWADPTGGKPLLPFARIRVARSDIIKTSPGYRSQLLPFVSTFVAGLMAIKNPASIRASRVEIL